MKNIWTKWALAFVAVLCLAACNDEDDDAVRTKITLDRTELTLAFGSSETLTATVTPPLASGQQIEWSSSDRSVAIVNNGTVTAMAAGTSNITARVGSAKAVCKVTVEVAAVTGISLDKTSLTLDIGQTETLTATIEPEEVLDKSVTWSSDKPEIASVEEGVVTAVAVGEAVITARAGDKTATCTVVVEASEPKIGDYFYSDGTWSDGGLVSIDADGLNPVWAETKPAPVAGKTVIGIVFQTFSDRIAQSDKDKGYTHGYVVAAKTAHGADKPTTFWTTSTDFEGLKAVKLASTWYANVNGYEETMAVKDKFSENLAELAPAFDLVLNGFTPAPASTSGWFLPSTGQLWDMTANLCGGEAAAVMKEWQTLDYDATYYCTENVSYDAIGHFNSMLSLVPDADKEEMAVNDAGHPFCSLWASTAYEEEAVCIMNIGQDGLIECMTDWYNSDCVARPILAF